LIEKSGKEILLIGNVDVKDLEDAKENQNVDLIDVNVDPTDIENKLKIGV